MLVKVIQWTTVCCFVTLTVLPLLYAIARLESVTGINSVVAVQVGFYWSVIIRYGNRRVVTGNYQVVTDNNRVVTG